MLAVLRCLGVGVFGVSVWAFCAGCGSSAAPKPAASKGAAGAPPTASIPGQAAVEDDEPDDSSEYKDVEVSEAAPKEGTPEWCVREATRLKLEPPPKTEDVDALRTHRRERNQKIISLCEQAIAKTHQDKEKSRLFEVSVHNLLEARLQLALGGAAEDVDALYKDAEALIERDTQSPAAMDASFTLVNLAYNLARRPEKSDVEWIKEFAKQSSFFAINYPKEELRGVPLLFTAARSCELNGLFEEAVNCYTVITKSYPKNQYAARAVTILRRLRLPGNAVQIAGPTLDGQQFALDDLLGKPVLVVFWSSEAKPFEEQLPTVKKVAAKHSEAGLTLVGINLDSEPDAAKQAMKTYKISWPQIVYGDPDQRGWNHPVANFYGVMEIPTYWLIDANGAVVSTTLTAVGLEAAVSEMLSGTAKPAAQSAAKETDAKQ
jgi:peroxiredoxin